MRLTVLILSVFLLSPSVLAEGPDEGSANGAAAGNAAGNAAGSATLALLRSDPAKVKVIKKGVDIARKFAKETWALEHNDKKASITRTDDARAKWNAWLGASKESLGLSLHANPRIVMEILDEARIGLLKSAVKLKKGQIDWGSHPAQGYSRGDIAYAVLVPKSYAATTEKTYPLVVTLHGRAINLRHPALKKHREQRSRIGVWNNWGGSGIGQALHEAIVIGPNGRPDGFAWQDGSFFVKQTLFLGTGVGCTNYRVDPQGIFVEVYGSAIVDAIESSTMFAGIIFRDREDAKSPAVAAEFSAIYENLNGMPLYYVADKAKWDKVGKATAEMLTNAYAAAGKPENLIIVQADRDANSALPADFEKLAKFLERRRPLAQSELTWLFWRSSMTAPLPIVLTRADYAYLEDKALEKIPLREKCGLIQMKVSIVTEEIDGKDVIYNRMDLEIFESDSLTLYLYEPLVNLDLPVTVRVNGKVIINMEVVRRDWKLFEKFCMSRNIYTLPIVATLELQFETKLRIEPPKEDPKKAADGETPKDGAEDSAKDADGAEPAGGS